MPIENERIYVIEPPAAELEARIAAQEGVEARRIEQHYLPGRGRVRRITDLATGEISHRFTIKYPGPRPGERVEIDEPIDAATWQSLSALSEARDLPRLTKRRYSFDGATPAEHWPGEHWPGEHWPGEHWDVDFLLGADGACYCARAEVELPERQDRPRALPDVLVGQLIHEVKRGAKGWGNKALADPDHAAEKLAGARRVRRAPDDLPAISELGPPPPRAAGPRL